MNKILYLYIQFFFYILVEKINIVFRHSHINIIENMAK
jgi:hypothetical protein